MLTAHTGRVLDVIAEAVQGSGAWHYKAWPAELADDNGMSSGSHHRSFTVQFVRSEFTNHDRGSASRRLRGTPQPYVSSEFVLRWFGYLAFDDAHEAYITTLNLQDEITGLIHQVPTGAPVRLEVLTAECSLGQNFDARGGIRIRATYQLDLT